MWIHNWKCLNLAEITVFQHSDDSGSKPVKRRRWTMISVFNGEAFFCLVMSLRSPSVPFLGINSRTQSLSMQSVFLWVPLIQSISSGFYMVLCRTDTKLRQRKWKDQDRFFWGLHCLLAQTCTGPWTGTPFINISSKENCPYCYCQCTICQE